MTFTPEQDSRLTAAARIVVAHVDNAGSPASYGHGQASGAVAVWAAMLGLSDDPDRAIGLARAQIAAAKAKRSEPLLTVVEDNP